jgi:hypothetical protein
LRGERERVIVCARSDHHQRLNSVDASELLSEYGCQCVRCDGCTQSVSTFFWTPLYMMTPQHVRDQVTFLVATVSRNNLRTDQYDIYRYIYIYKRIHK